MRQTDSFEGLVGDLAMPPHGEFYSGAGDDVSAWGDGVYLGMFRSDFALLMHRGRPSEDAVVAAVKTATADIIAAGLPNRYGPLADLRTAVPDFIHAIAYELLDGAVTFDVEYFRRPNADRPCMFRFLPRFNGAVAPARLQPVPDGASEAVRFDLPTATRDLFDGARPLWVAADRSSDVAMRFIGEAGIGYDFDFQHTSIKQYVLQQTWDIGWDARGTFSDILLDPMKAALRLRFVRLQIQTRSHLLHQLQTHLDAIGAALQQDLSLKFVGLRSEADIAKAERALQAGEANIVDLLHMQP